MEIKLNLKNDFGGSRLLFYNESRSSNRLGDFFDEFKNINKNSILDFLFFGTILTPRSPLVGISQLFPGEEIKNGQSNSEYRELNCKTVDKNTEEFVNDLDKHLNNYFSRVNLNSAILLSGGIDSAILASYLSKDSACITWGGWGENTSDVKYSKITREKLGIKNHFFVYADYEKDFELYKKTIIELKIPILFNNAAPYIRMAEFANSVGIKNWFMGQNADTLFMSYPAPVLANKLIRINKFLPFNPFFFLKSRKKYLFSTTNLIRLFAYFKSLGVFPGKWINIPEGYFEEKELILKNCLPPGTDLDQKIILTEEILTEARRNQIYQNEIPVLYDVKVGCPFFERKIVELALSIPRGLRRMGGYNKVVLRELAKKRGIPELIINKKKSGLSYGYNDFMEKKMHVPIWNKMEKDDLLNSFINIKEIRKEREDSFLTFNILSSLYYWIEFVARPNNLILK